MASSDRNTQRPYFVLNCCTRWTLVLIRLSKLFTFNYSYLLSIRFTCPSFFTRSLWKLFGDFDCTGCTVQPRMMTVNNKPGRTWAILKLISGRPSRLWHCDRLGSIVCLLIVSRIVGPHFEWRVVLYLLGRLRSLVPYNNVPGENIFNYE
jgi:hypothetical protein